MRSLLVNKKYTGAFIRGKYTAGYTHGTENGEITTREADKNTRQALSSTQIGLRRLSRVVFSGRYKSGLKSSVATPRLCGSLANAFY